MYISARERQILELLIINRDGITVKAAADKLDVSERTIHRDLKGIEEILKKYELALKKQSGVGIEIIGGEESVKELELFLFNCSHSEYTPEERHTLILCALLEAKEPVKLASLALDLNVTVGTISNDLNKIEEFLSMVDLILVRRRGYGVEIEGSERAKRKAMSALIVEAYDEAAFLTVIRDNIQKKMTNKEKTSTERLLGLVEREKLVIVERAIEEINNKLSYPIADSAYIGLVVHLALAMERIAQGEKVEMDAGYLDNLQRTKEFQAAEKIAAKLEKVFQITIPKAEIGYITMHLRGAKLRYDKEVLLEEEGLQIAKKVKQLIFYVAEKTDQDINQDKSLFQGLLTHLKPAIYRIKQNMRIHNPLLERMKDDYSELFLILRNGVEEIFAPLNIPDAEIGFLVMHFGSVIEKDKVKRNVRALVICSSGIGSSKLLSSRIKKKIPEIKHIENASLFELERLDLSNFDLLISTVPISDSENDYILVQSFLSDSEVAKIYEAMEQKKVKMVEGVQEKELLSGQNMVATEALGSFRSIKRFSQAVEDILAGFQHEHFSDGDVVSVLMKACMRLFQKGVVASPSKVVAALLEREKLGGVGIPNTTLALFHTRSKDINRISFSIQSLQKKEKRKAMDDSEIEVKNILLLLAPEHPTQEQLELLSYISSLTIESEDTIQLFESQQEEQISSFLAHRFHTFLEEKFTSFRRERYV